MLGNELSWQATCSGNLHICTQQHWTSTRHCDEQSGRLASVTVFQTFLHTHNMQLLVPKSTSAVSDGRSVLECAVSLKL